MYVRTSYIRLVLRHCFLVIRWHCVRMSVISPHYILRRRTLTTIYVRECQILHRHLSPMRDSFPIIMREEQRGHDDVTVYSHCCIMRSSLVSVQYHLSTGSESASIFESNCGHLATNIAFFFTLIALFRVWRVGTLVQTARQLWRLLLSKIPFVLYICSCPGHIESSFFKYWRPYAKNILTRYQVNWLWILFHWHRENSPLHRWVNEAWGQGSHVCMHAGV